MAEYRMEENMKEHKRVRAVISLDAIAHNFQEMKNQIAEGTKIDLVLPLFALKNLKSPRLLQTYPASKKDK